MACICLARCGQRGTLQALCGWVKEAHRNGRVPRVLEVPVQRMVCFARAIEHPGDAVLRDKASRPPNSRVARELVLLQLAKYRSSAQAEYMAVGGERGHAQEQNHAVA